MAGLQRPENREASGADAGRGAGAVPRDGAKSAAPVTFEVVVHPDGTKSVDLQGAFAMSLVARRNADGSISYDCRPAAAAARKPQGARGTARFPAELRGDPEVSAKRDNARGAGPAEK